MDFTSQLDSFGFFVMDIPFRESDLSLSVDEQDESDLGGQGNLGKFLPFEIEINKYFESK